MALESPVVRIEDLVSTNPAAGDVRSEGDDHIRNIKIAVKGSFPYTSASSATLRRAANNVATCTGTNTLTCGLTPALNAYVEGQVFHFEMAAAKNTGAVTLNIDSKGAGALTWPDATALADGDLPASSYFSVIVKDAGTPIFHLLTGARKTVPPAGHIQGLTYASAADVTNDITVATGSATDSTGVDTLTLASALTKQLDAAWAVGDNQGGRTGAAIANTDYNIWEIKRIDTGVVDICFEQTAQSTPTLPTNYTLYRKVGVFKRESAAIVPFSTLELAGGGLRYEYKTTRLDINSLNTLANSRLTSTLSSVPQTFSVKALLRAGMGDSTESGGGIICPTFEVDAIPSSTTIPLANFAWPAGGNDFKDLEVTTSSTGQISARSNVTGTVDGYVVAVRGFEWSRR